MSIGTCNPLSVSDVGKTKPITEYIHCFFLGLCGRMWLDSED